MVPQFFSALKLESMSESELEAAFEAVDKDGSGWLELPELTALMRGAGLDARRAEGSAVLLMRRFDKDGDGRIRLEEFKSGVFELSGEHRVSSVLAEADGVLGGQPVGAYVWASLNLTSFSSEELRQAFDELDSDRNGLLDVAEISALLQQDRIGLDAQQADASAKLLVRKLDLDSDGLVSFEEFTTGLRELAQQRDLRIWPLAGLMFVSGASVGATTPALPLLSHELNLTPAQFGYTVSALGLSTMLANVPNATFMDSHGRRPIMLCGLCLQGLSLFGTAASGSLPAFLASRLVNGFGVSGLIVSTSMVCADLSTPLNRTKMAATANCAFAAGKVLGPAIGGYLIGCVGLSTTFAAAGACYLASAAGARLLIEETMPQRRAAAPAAAQPTVRKTLQHLFSQWREIIRGPEMRNLMLLNALSIGTHAGASMALMPLMLAGSHHALTPLQIGYVFAFQSGVAVFGAAPAAALADRFGPACTLAPAVAMNSVAMLAFPLVDGAAQLGAVLALWGLSRSLLNLAPGSLAMGLTVPEARAQTLAMLRTTGDLGFFAGTALVGMGGAALGAGAAMQCTGAVSGMAAMCYAASRLLPK